MAAKCTGSRDYQCTDGTCGYHEYSCRSAPNSKCDHYLYDFLCPDGECAKSDAGCLRPCRTAINGERYQYPCDGYPGFCRASNGHDCPTVCNDPTPAKCAGQNCVKNEKFCQDCDGYRCDNGDCTYSYFDRCNEVVDCADGSDEWKSTCDPYSELSDTIPIAVSVVVCGIVIIIIVVIVVCALCLNKRRYGTYTGSRAASGAQTRTQAMPMTYIAPNVYQPPRVSGALPPTGTSPYGQPPQQQQYGPQYAPLFGNSQPPVQPTYQIVGTVGPPPSYDEVAMMSPGDSNT